MLTLLGNYTHFKTYLIILINNKHILPSLYLQRMFFITTIKLKACPGKKLQQKKYCKGYVINKEGSNKEQC